MTDEAQERAAAAARSCAARIRELAESHPSSPYVLPSDLDHAEVRACISDYARSLRVAGVSPEQMIVLVKHLVTTAAAGAGTDARPLISVAVTWAIAAYYEQCAVI